MANHRLGHISKAIDGRLKEVIIMFHSALVKPNLEYYTSPASARYSSLSDRQVQDVWMSRPQGIQKEIEGARCIQSSEKQDK